MPSSLAKHAVWNDRAYFSDKTLLFNKLNLCEGHFCVNNLVYATYRKLPVSCENP